MRLDRQRLGQFAIAQDFDSITQRLDQTGLAEGFEINDAAGLKQIEVTQVYQSVDFLDQRREAALGQAPLQRSYNFV